MLLDIELVPESSWLNNVRAIVSRAQWDIIRNKVYDRAWHTCEICGGVGTKHPVECHEIWHYDDLKLIQKLKGMIALCPNCHLVKHMGFARISNKEDIAVAHFMKVNKLKKPDANRYISDAFAKWAARSKKKWILDISHLTEYGIDINKIHAK